MHYGRKHRTRKRKNSRRMRGGAGNTLSGNNYEQVSGSGPSGWSYVSGLVGGLDQQYNGALVGNGSGNQLAINSRATSMSGGRRRRRNRRGGSIGPIIYDAVVPLTLLAAQQSYKKGTKTNKRTRRNRRR